MLLKIIKSERFLEFAQEMWLNSLIFQSLQIPCIMMHVRFWHKADIGILVFLFCNMGYSVTD